MKKQIKQIQNKKAELEKNIHNLLEEFERDTGLEINSVEMNILKMKDFCDNNNVSFKTNVRINIEL